MQTVLRHPCGLAGAVLGHLGAYKLLPRWLAGWLAGWLALGAYGRLLAGWLADWLDSSLRIFCLKTIGK